ncbi:AT-hook motif nuclear-localized protein 11-like [Impatiens glandulifera]|uniref:AT-hook motif nuclear-localized protein 11-like n=1 Tax=Impatiens glandulifera TaxID=253017 RepID=UPI001FB0709F|nr:AT-hook motif nuclear-localized protein 11-like [Impatiens glandulifera]
MCAKEESPTRVMDDSDLSIFKKIVDSSPTQVVDVSDLSMVEKIQDSSPTQVVDVSNLSILEITHDPSPTQVLYWYATIMQKNICLMSATDSILEVTLQQEDNYFATIKYEGLYKIVTLSGLILPIRQNTTDSTIAAKQGGLMVAFEGEDGRCVNSLVSSSLIAYEKVEVLASIYASRPGEYKTWEEMESSDSIQLSSPVPSGSSLIFQSISQWVTSTTNPVAERAEVTSNNDDVIMSEQRD